jgi:hypothetical protein
LHPDLQRRYIEIRIEANTGREDLVLRVAAFAAAIKKALRDGIKT